MSGDRPELQKFQLTSTSPNEQVSTSELRRLLSDITDSSADVSVRFRVMGEMWQERHHRIVTFAAPGITLRHEGDIRPVTINNVDNIMQFELDRKFGPYQPHVHYSVTTGDR